MKGLVGLQYIVFQLLRLFKEKEERKGACPTRPDGALTCTLYGETGGAKVWLELCHMASRPGGSFGMHSITRWTAWPGRASPGSPSKAGQARQSISKTPLAWQTRPGRALARHFLHGRPGRVKRWTWQTSLVQTVMACVL
jgi:hypothetical protein